MIRLIDLIIAAAMFSSAAAAPNEPLVVVDDTPIGLVVYFSSDFACREFFRCLGDAVWPNKRGDLAYRKRCYGPNGDWVRAALQTRSRMSFIQREGYWDKFGNGTLRKLRDSGVSVLELHK